MSVLFSRPLRVGIPVAVAVAVVVSLVGAVPAYAAPPTYSGSTGLTGARPSATSLSFRVSDQASASVDVATGNLLVRSSSLALVGVSAAVRISASYNSLGTSSGSTSSVQANKWTLGLDGAGFLSQGPAAAMVYTGGDGATWSFAAVAGQNTYTSPAGFKQDLVKSTYGWTLTDRVSRRVVTFNSDGMPISVADRNGNTTTMEWYPGLNFVESSAGPVAARRASVAYDASTFTTTFSQSSGSSSRSVRYVKDASSNLVKVVDALGKETAFAYTGGRMTQITAPTNQVTTIGYDGSGRVVSVAQGNTSAGSPGTSTTRLAYPSTTQTLVARPNTNQSSAVSAVPHLTYAVDASTKLVTSATDEMNRSRSATYTPQADVATSTQGSGASGGTTTNEYNANGGDSQTKSTSPGGAAVSASYGNTAAATKYLASASSDDAGNSSSFTYNGSGNQLTSADALAATATLTYNADGTVASALAPGNGSNTTVYAYNANKQLASVTPVTGSSLGVRTFSYDDFGRTKTATDGRGVTVTYGYDQQDRVLTTAFSDSTPTVVNAYTDAGQIQSRQDANGTTSYGYDQLGRLTSRQNSFAGGVIGYGYDRASNLVTVSDSRGMSTNAFDESGVPTKITYAKGSGTAVLAFVTDNRGRRTDTYLNANASLTTWNAHTRQEYDTSGRVARVIAESNDGSTTSTVMDVSYCYNTGTAAPSCATGTAGDRSKLQWQYDNLTGQSTAFSYDAAGRLAQAAQSGGTGANTWAYSYDTRGNRLTANVTGASPSSQTLTANAANQISTAGYSYDGAGNLTADPSGTYGYTGAEQMKSVTRAGTSYSYKYAGAGQQEVLQQQSTQGTIQLVYGRGNAQGLPVIEQAKVGSVTAYVENDPVTGQPLMLKTSTGTQSLYVYTGQGSPVALLRDFGGTGYTYKYDPYGVATLTSDSGGTGKPQNPFLFAGGIQDRATGWVKYGARWYNPGVGRWTQQDTLDTPLNPANANRYAYAGDDPINVFDPTGLVVYKTAIRVIEALFLGYDVLEIFSTGTLIGLVAGAIFGSLCVSALTTFTGGLALVGAVVGCNILSNIFADSVDKAISGG